MKDLVGMIPGAFKSHDVEIEDDASSIQRLLSIHDSFRAKFSIDVKRKPEFQKVQEQKLSKSIN
jgi:hypothetical protein